MNATKTSIYLPNDLADFIQKKAKADRVSKSQIVQEALRAFAKEDPVGIEMEMQKLAAQEQEINKQKNVLQEKYKEVQKRRKRLKEGDEKIAMRKVIP